VLLILVGMTHSLAGQIFLRAEEEAKLDQISHMNGVAAADYDQDGDLDLFFTGFHSFVASDENTWNRLMKNNGDGTFADVTVEAGFGIQFSSNAVLSTTGIKLGVAWGDYDNDGYPDIYLTNRGGNLLYHNEGDGTFTDVTADTGVEGCLQCFNSSALWWDHDRDGDLDLYVSVLDGPNIMYENLGDGTFEDITGLLDLGGDGVTWSSVPIDIGKDGFLDLYLANDTQINQLFENRSGLSYKEASRAYRLADEGAGMGLAVGDYNHDGLFDIYVTNIYSHQSNPLFTNLGGRRFENHAEEMGVHNAGWGWGTKFFDCDHDGDEDLFAVTGVVSEQYIYDILQEDTENFFFRNTLMEGTMGFENWSVESGASGGIEGRARGLEVLDYDNDGDLDMVIANLEMHPYLFRNNVIEDSDSDTNNWIKIWLEGSESNRNAFGSEVKITIGDQSYYRWYHGSGFYGQSVQPVHFGLGDAETIDEIQVTWPLGLVQKFSDVTANNTIYLIEGEITTAVAEELLPAGPIKLNKQFPNPFKDEVTFEFEIDAVGTLELRIYSLLGHTVNKQVHRGQNQGFIAVKWDGRNLTGTSCPPGFYFFEATLGKYRINGSFVKLDGRS